MLATKEFQNRGLSTERVILLLQYVLFYFICHRNTEEAKERINYFLFG